MHQHLQEQVRHSQTNGSSSVKHSLVVYFHRCWSVLTDAAVLLPVTVLGYIVILYICKIATL